MGPRKEKRERRKKSSRKRKITSKRLLLIIAVSLGILALFSCYEHLMPITYKYKVVSVGAGLESDLEKYADQGWELHSTAVLGNRVVLKKRAWFVERFF